MQSFLHVMAFFHFLSVSAVWSWKDTTGIKIFKVDFERRDIFFAFYGSSLFSHSLGEGDVIVHMRVHEYTVMQ